MFGKTMKAETFMWGWVIFGACTHFYWWNKFCKGEWETAAVVLCGCSLLGAAVLGPLNFFLYLGLYWLAGPHEE